MTVRKDAAEKEIVEAFEKGKLKRSKNAAKLMQIAKEAAAGYLKKDSRINIRLSSPDLKLLKRRAAEEGVPYQTLITSILHKFITGRLSNSL